MAKILSAKKIIVDIAESGEASGAVLVYQVNDGGVISRIRSVSVLSALQAEGINSIIADAKASAGTSEGI